MLALGPALGRGFVLTYDMVFVPDPPISLADLGFSGGPARAVPSDLVVALAARVLPAQFVQKLILIAIFTLACAGAAALVAQGWYRHAGDSRLPVLAGLVAGVMYAWNPFVAERLIMGQWAMLLGYAGLPWVLRELARTDGEIRARRLAVAILPAAVGGFAAMSITAVAAVPAALCLGPCRRPLAQRGTPGGAPSWLAQRRVGVTLAVLGLASLPWVVPSLIVPVHADPGGAAAFAARADTPFGAAGSVLMLGGIWNAQAVPAGYGGLVSVCWLLVVVVAVAGYVVAARPRLVCAGLGIAAVAGFSLATLGTWSPGLAVLRDAISFWPGFALLRDGQQFVAPLALAESVGLGAGVAAFSQVATRRAASERGSQGRQAAGLTALIGVFALLAPVVLLPGLAWGAAGRLRPAQYPADWLAARSVIEGSSQRGSVLLLPWAQYRRYAWNDGEAVFDPWPRLLARPVIWNDALTVGRTTVAAESASARRLRPAIASRRPLTRLLRSAGVRYVIVDAGRLLDRPQPRLAALARLPGARVVLASRDLIVFRVPD